MTFLISISVGPVQDFISTARRTRDLWFGSWLLSELSKVVAATIKGDLTGELIFPASLDGNVVNKILAVVADPGKVEIECRNAILKRLKELYAPVFDELDHKKNGVLQRERAEDQINEMVELYWAAVPFDDKDYVNCRKRVETLLSARKATRDFRAPTWSDAVPKSSLDGQRESVINDTKIDDRHVQRIFGLRKKERLCGVGLLKRLAQNTDEARFFSTSHTAALPLLANPALHQKVAAQEALFDYVSTLTSVGFEVDDEILKHKHRKHPVFGSYDGRMLFESRLKDITLLEDKSGETTAKEALKTLLKEFGCTSGPSPYYALLLADGDRMGSVIDNQTSKADHQGLSKVLVNFAGKCHGIIEEYDGCLVYAGGDDVLALLPLHTLLECARTLADAFQSAFESVQNFRDANGNSPTLSVGVAIYHHTEPLQDALATMRRAEKLAKNHDPERKNSLAIILSKRGGSDTEIVGSWLDDRETGASFDQRLKRFIQLHVDDALPDGVAYELRDLWLRFKDVPAMATAIKRDAVRILKRKRSGQGAQELADDILKEIETLIMSDSIKLGEIADEIIVAKEFAGAYEQSGRQVFDEETRNDD